MRRVWLITAGLLLAAARVPAQVPGLDSAGQAGVARLLERFDASASAGGRLDGDSRAALFTDDAVVINAFSTYLEGRAAVDSFWRVLYHSSTFDSAKIERLERRSRLIAPELVLVDHLERLTGQRTPTSHRELPPRLTRITLILRRETSNQWRILYYRAGDQRTLQGPAPSAASPP
jgi:ketosteroid isomerase-like protein